MTEETHGLRSEDDSQMAASMTTLAQTLTEGVDPMATTSMNFHPKHQEDIIGLNENGGAFEDDELSSEGME